MATIRGLDGSVTFNAVALGNCRVMSFDTTRGLIDSSVKGDFHGQRVGGQVIHTATFAGLLDYVTGQKDAIDRLETATPNTTAATLVFTLATGKTWTWTSGALLAGYRVSSPEGDALVTVEYDFHLNVSATIAYA
jgi:hypothetical protein